RSVVMGRGPRHGLQPFVDLAILEDRSVILDPGQPGRGIPVVVPGPFLDQMRIAADDRRGCVRALQVAEKSAAEPDLSHRRRPAPPRPAHPAPPLVLPRGGCPGVPPTATTLSPAQI